MIRFDISAYADYTTSWGEPCYVGVLSIKESQEGKWVMADAVDVFVDGQVSEARRLLTLEHIRETSEMRTKLHEMNMSGAADTEDYAKDLHYYATEIEKLKLQLETMTNDRDAEKSMKATARMQRDTQTKLANDRLTQIDALHTDITNLIRAGAFWKGLAVDSYTMLKKIPGLQSHPLWLELQSYLKKFEDQMSKFN